MTHFVVGAAGTMAIHLIHGAVLNFIIYWTGILDILNKVFQSNIPADPKPCVLGILDNLTLQEAVSKQLF